MMQRLLSLISTAPSASAPSAPPPPRPRRRIRSVRTVILKNLSAHEQERLVDEIFVLWREHFVGLSRQRFVETHLRPETRLCTFHGEDGELAAFLNLNVDRVEVAGHRSLVITSGAFSRLDYDAGRMLILRGSAEALRLKLRHPLTSVASLPFATSPVAYRSAARWSRRCYPSPDHEAPAHVAAMAADVARRRGLSVNSEDPWLVPFLVSQRHPDDIERSRAMRAADRFTLYYLRRNPHWSEGNALMVWVPMGAIDFLVAAGRVLFKLPRR